MLRYTYIVYLVYCNNGGGGSSGSRNSNYLLLPTRIRFVFGILNFHVLKDVLFSFRGTALIFRFLGNRRGH